MIRQLNVHTCDAIGCSNSCPTDGDTSDWSLSIDLRAFGIALSPDLCPRHVELIRSLLSNAIPVEGTQSTTADPRAAEWSKLAQQMSTLLSYPQPELSTWWQLFSARWEAIQHFLNLVNNELSENEE